MRRAAAGDSPPRAVGVGELELPNGTRTRDYDGQRFWHGAVDGVAAATGERIAIRIARQLGSRTVDQLLFGFVLSGTITLRCKGSHRLATGDAFVVPPAMPFALTDPSGTVSVFEATIRA